MAHPSAMPASRPAAPKPSLLQRDVKTLILSGLWFLFVLVNLLEALDAAITIGQSWGGIEYYPRHVRVGFGSFGNIEPPETFSLAARATVPLALNLWGFVAALFFRMLVVPNRHGWGNGKRFALGGLALAMMLGQVVSGGLVGLAAAYVPIQLWLALLATPVVLLVAGLLTIITVGVVALGLFSVFVGVPVTIFNQVFAFEHAERLSLPDPRPRRLSGPLHLLDTQ